MQLVALAKNPVPSGAVVGSFSAFDGLALRYACWEATRGPYRGTVCVFPGRGEYIEKYFEVVADLRRRGYAVAAMDWRGQGGSARMLANPRKGYVRTFADYDRDLASFMEQVVLPTCPGPYIALAHSMGGNILLRNAVDPASHFERMVLSAPMIAFADARVGYPQGPVRVIMRIATLLGAGRLYIPGGTDNPMELGPFEGNPITSDPERYNRNRLVLEAAPELALGSPTNSWVNAAYRSIGQLTQPDYPARVRVPLLVFAAGMDTVVSTTAIEEFCLRLKVGQHLLLPEARHEILQERDEIRHRFWTAFDAYLGLDVAAA